MTTAMLDVTVDAFLGGRVDAVQLGHGNHRSGLEAVLLAAAVDTDFAGAVVDFGAGTGVAGMCVAARCADTKVTLVDRDPAALAAAKESLARPVNRSFSERVRIVTADIALPEGNRALAGLGRETADCVILNPPFHNSGDNRTSPHAARASAHVLEDGLEPWLRTAASILKPSGVVIVIFRADGVEELLSGLADRFGGIAILPLHPREGLRAHRILVRGVKGSRARTEILPGLVLHGVTGSAYQPAAQEILRDGAGLADVHPAWAM